MVDPFGRTMSLTYDTAGRPTQQTLSDGRIVLFGYDTDGNLTTVVPPGASAHTFSYTANNGLASYTAPNIPGGTGQSQYFYNADRQPDRVSFPDGRTIEFAYDSAGRRSTLTLGRGSQHYTYHATTGKLATIEAPGGLTLSYTYDGPLLLGASLTEPVPGSVTRAYDNNFRVSSLAVNGSTIPFSYDADGRLTQAGSLALTRSSQHGLLIGTSLGNVVDTMDYNEFGELTSYRARYGNVDQYVTQYTHDEIGRVTRLIETVGVTTDTYEDMYDLTGRLEIVKQNGATVSNYTYDQNGNRLTVATPGGMVMGTYDAQDRLTQYGATMYL